VISALLLFIQTEVGLDPSSFFHKSEYHEILNGNWDKEKREYKNVSMLNQEQYLNELEECFLANREFVPSIVQMESSTSPLDIQKGLAMANREEEVSVVSALTDKTLKEASTLPGHQKASSATSSVASGMTSRSKTQLAVKEALKEVSVEHNRAMEEQQRRFRQEIDELRKVLERSTRVGSSVQDAPHDSSERGDVEMELVISPPEVQVMQVDINEAPSELDSPTRTVTPASKRPKRSTSRLRKGRGGPSSATSMLNE